MNAKNIILGLSLILSSVATLNLTSCSDEEQEYIDHEYNSISFDNEQTLKSKTENNVSIKAAKIAKDTITSQLGTDVKNYMAKLLGDQTSYLSVQEQTDRLTVQFVYEGNDEAVLSAVYSKFSYASNENSELATMVLKSKPEAKYIATCSKNGSLNSNTYFTFTFKTRDYIRKQSTLN